MAPWEQGFVSRSGYVLCNTEFYAGLTVGSGEPDVSNLATVKDASRGAAVPGGAGRPVQATSVTSRLSIGRQVQVTVSLSWLLVEGAWRWSLPSAQAKLYQSSLCPARPPGVVAVEG